MKKSSEYIAESVFNVNAHYTELQNKTKIFYFKCLQENKSSEYFREEVYKIWGNVDHEFMDKQIDKLEKMVNDNNVKMAINTGRLDNQYKPSGAWEIDDEYFKLVPESQFNQMEKKFASQVSKSYDKSKKTMDKVDKETYLQKKIRTYDEEVDQVVAYFNNAGEVVRHTQLSTYLSMIHNTNLTRAGWNQTMRDSEMLDRDLFIIPFHPFSCLDCFYYQNRILTKSEVEHLIGVEAEEQEGDLLHPNCKCSLEIFWDNSQIKESKYTTDEVESMYHTRQQVNSLTLKKSKIITDMKIQKSLGNEEAYDKLNQKRNAINSQIRDLKSDLPTASLQKQVGAINR